MSEKFSRYNVTEYLGTQEEMAAYLEAFMDEGNSFFAKALGDIARAKC